MKERGLRRLLLAVPLLGTTTLPPVGAAELLPAWDIDGSHTARAEVYETAGDGGASPYPEEGAQEYGEFSLGLSRRFNPWHRLRVYMDGLLNDSFYRSNETGVVPERLQLSWERGDGALPFRLEAGDLFGFFSYRLLQRSLKGFQLDLQPRHERSGRRSSLLLLVGTNQRAWKNLQFSDDLTTGVSWVLEDGWGRLALNVLGNYRARDAAAGLPTRRQWVESLAAELPFDTANWQGAVEGEFAYFAGDHNGINGNDGLDREDSGIYLQVRGRNRHLPFGYRLRFERYGEDFQPAGAVVTPDRRSYELHGDWRFGWGATLRGRAQLYEDAMESGNPLETTTFGLNYSGSLLGPWDPLLSGGIDLYWQERSNRNDAVDTVTRSLTASLARPLGGGWSGDVSLNWVTTENDAAGGSTVVTRHLNLGLSHELSLRGWRGAVRPGLSLIHNSGRGSFDQYAPTLAVGLARDRHRLDAHLNLARQEAGVIGGIDTDIATFALRYGYRPTEQDEITADLDVFARQPDPGRGTEAYRVGVAWRHSFSRPRRVVAAAGGGAAARSAALQERAALLTAIAPGSTLAAARERVREAGLGAPRRIGDLWIYEGRLLEAIDLRQRFVLRAEGDRVLDTALVIDFRSLGDVDSVEQRFERVREALLRRFGPPDADFSRGELSPALAADVRARRLIRVMEWRLSGGVLRFGIPRRLDGKVRMEVRYAASFPVPYDGDWSVSELP